MMNSTLSVPERFCLGTVQFGTYYGINNAIGRQPNRDECFLMLKKAIDLGIKYFDTAISYGNAESILGDFKIGKYPVHVLSKIVAEPNYSNNDVKYEINKSLKRMGVSCIYGYMLHCPLDADKPEIIQGLEEAKHEGLIQHIGVSVYTPEEAIHVMDKGFIDILQIPYNVFDRRWERMEVFSIAEKNNIKIFARSVFLQGLLLMEPVRLPDNFSKIKNQLSLFRNICQQYRYEPYEAALLYAVSNPQLQQIVFGIDTVNQLLQNIRSLNKFEGFNDCYVTLRRNFLDISARFLMPNLWNEE